MSLCNKLHYVYSCDVDLPLTIKVGALEGPLPSVDMAHLIQHCACTHHLCNDSPPTVYVQLQVYSDGRAIGQPIQTSHRSFSPNGTCKWNEWLTLPLTYAQLSPDAHLTVDICDTHVDGRTHVIAGTAIALFSKRHMFRNGIYDLHMHPFVAGDIRSTPCKPSTVAEGEEDIYDVDGDDEQCIRRFSKLRKRHKTGLMEKVDWLDRQAFRAIEVPNDACKRNTHQLYAMVEFAAVHLNDDVYRVVYYERNGDQHISTAQSTSIVHYVDHELGMENLVEHKHTILTRTSRSDAMDRQLKPTAAVRDQLEYIVQMPCCQIVSADQRDLVWKYRYYLQANKRALVKFLQSVNWHVSSEVNHALTLMREWSPMDVIDDALQLLSFEFKHAAVRRYAVSRLAESTDAELQLYLLQLVQALKFEHIDGTATSSSEGTRRRRNVLLAEEADEMFMQDEQQRKQLSEQRQSDDARSVDDPPEWWANWPDLATFLIDRATKHGRLANYLYWYLQVERESYSTTTTETGERQSYKELYTNMLRKLSKRLAGSASVIRNELLAEQAFVNRLVQLMQAVAKEGGNRTNKISYMKGQLGAQVAPTSSSSIDFNTLHAVPLPLDPDVRISSVVVDRTTLFNSARMPVRLTFRTVDDKQYTTIFKHGDDLRQDQLIMQLINLMDKLLQSDNLDLRLTTYKVLATGVDHGFVQFVESVPLRDVLRDYDASILSFLRFFRPCAADPLGVEVEVMDNYIRSTAGYSVISYILGLGDRHLHNLLLQKNGRMFHIDFGYILGRDPKPMPPPMKITDAMIDGMGGSSSPQCAQFRNLCITTFLHLRRHANLVLNLFALMTHANISDIALEPDAAVGTVHERFHLDLSDEEAVRMMHQLIDASLSAKMAVVNDYVHDLAQKLRS